MAWLTIRPSRRDSPFELKTSYSTTISVKITMMMAIRMSKICFFFAKDRPVFEPGRGIKIFFRRFSELYAEIGVKCGEISSKPKLLHQTLIAAFNSPKLFHFTFHIVAFCRSLASCLLKDEFSFEKFV